MLDPQNIAALNRHSLRPSIAIFCDMSDETLPIGHILARNLRSLMDGHLELQSAAAVSRATLSTVSDNTILNMLKPERGIAATIDNVQAVAAVFERQAWQLLHPDLELADRAQALVDSVRARETPVGHEELQRSTLPKPTANPPRAPTVHQPRAPYRATKQTAKKP